MTDISRSRVEMKYLLPAERLPELLVRVPPHQREDYRVTTLYFDRPDGSLSRLALEQPYECTKVRARDYLDGSPYVWFEVKSRLGQWTRKSRTKVARADLTQLLGGLSLSRRLPLPEGPADGEDDGGETLRLLEDVRRRELIPIGAVHVLRKTFMLPEVSLRFTLDEGISYYRTPERPYWNQERLVPESLGPLLQKDTDPVLEMKHAGTVPSWCLGVVSGLTKSAYSKFRTLVRCIEQASRVADRVD